MKNFLISIISLLLAFCCVACGNFTLESDKLEKDVIDNVKFSSPLEEIDNVDTINVLYALPEGVTANSVWRGNSISADEFCIFTASDSSGADATEQMALERISSQKETYQSYAPDEVTKLNNAIISKKGNYVVLLVTDDYENGKSIIDKYLK